jgi:hypothetical protein
MGDIDYEGWWRSMAHDMPTIKSPDFTKAMTMCIVWCGQKYTGTEKQRKAFRRLWRKHHIRRRA